MISRFLNRIPPKRDEKAVFNSAYRNFEDELQALKIEPAYSAARDIIADYKKYFQEKALEICIEVGLFPVEADGSAVSKLIRAKTNEINQLTEVMRTKTSLLSSWGSVEATYAEFLVKHEICKGILEDTPSSITHIALRYVRIIANQAAEIQNDLNELLIASENRDEMTSIVQEYCQQIMQLTTALTERIPALLYAYDEENPMHPSFKELTTSFLSAIDRCKTLIQAHIHNAPESSRAAHSHISQLIIEALELSFNVSQLRNVPMDAVPLRLTNYEASIDALFKGSYNDAGRITLLQHFENSQPKPILDLDQATYETAWMNLFCTNMKALIKSLNRQLPAHFLWWQGLQAQKENIELAYQQFMVTVKHCKNTVLVKAPVLIDKLLKEYIDEMSILAEEVMATYEQAKALHSSDREALNSDLKLIEKEKCEVLIALSSGLHQQIDAWINNSEVDLPLFALKNLDMITDLFLQKVEAKIPAAQKSAYKIQEQLQSHIEQILTTYQTHQSQILAETAEPMQKRLAAINLIIQQTEQLNTLKFSLRQIMNLLNVTDAVNLSQVFATYEKTALNTPEIRPLVSSLARFVSQFLQSRLHITTGEESEETRILAPQRFSPRLFRKALIRPLSVDLRQRKVNLNHTETRNDDTPSPTIVNSASR